MAWLTPDTLQKLARELYGYEMPIETAKSIVAGAGAMMSMSDHLDTLGLDAVEPPFGYPNLLAEASRMRPRKSRTPPERSHPPGTERPCPRGENPRGKNLARRADRRVPGPD